MVAFEISNPFAFDLGRPLITASKPIQRVRLVREDARQLSGINRGVGLDHIRDLATVGSLCLRALTIPLDSD